MRRWILLTLLLLPLHAFAAGGACPTGANYINAAGAPTKVTLSSIGVTSCYYASASGVDTATGTDETHPWLHLPGMTGCANNCSSVSVTAGEGFIIQGGTTYHFSGRGTPVGLPWAWGSNGTGANPIYLGVDQTWFSGGSWTRPVFTGDNSTSTSSGGVGSCSHNDDGEDWVSLAGTTHIIADNLEAMGMCWNTGAGLVIFNSGSSNSITWTNDYIHGWTRTTGCTASGCAEGAVGFSSDNGPDTGPGDPGWLNVYAQVIADGADSDNKIFTTMEWQCYDVHNSVFNRYTNIVCAHHLFYGNTLSNTAQSSVTPDHGNVHEENGSVQNAGPNAWFNNLIHDNANGVTIWLNPQVGSTDYVFNNVFWNNTNSGNTFDVGDPSGDIGSFVVFNQSAENPENGPVVNCQSTTHAYSLSITNFHAITDGGAVTNGVGHCSTSPTTSLVQTHSTATGQGFTASEAFVYSPTALSNSTIHAGTNQASSPCNALSVGGNAIAAAACLSDTSYACTYDSTAHATSCPARVSHIRPTLWDIGAYQLGTTWYIRADGGTRFSTNATSGQCDGQADVSYASTGGTGINQHCAFNDDRFLWTDGTFNNGVTFPGWGWLPIGGDTMIVRNCIQYSAPFTPIPGSSGSCRMGYNGPQNSTDWFGGIPGDAPDSEMPPIPSGISSQHTQFLGGNFGSCAAQGSATLTNPGYTVFIGINLSGSNWVDVNCFDVSDHAACAHSTGTTNQCAVSSPFDDFGSRGVQFSRTTTNVTVSNVWAHGLASDCFSGPTGTGTVVQNIHLQGCPDSTWNMDPGDGTTGTGTLLVSNFTMTAGGFIEQYPVVDPMPFLIGFDDSDGGYGDCVGTTTNPSAPGWNVTMQNGTVRYCTQDGIDFLHLTGSGSSITLKNITAYGSMGQQLKAGGSQPTMINNYIYGNCNALRQSIPGFPAGFNTGLSDFCRAADETVATLIDDAYTSTYQFNTMYSAQTSGWTIFCAISCSAPNVVFQNNTFLSFLNNTTNGYPGGGSGQQSQAVLLDNSIAPITQGDGIWLNSGSAYNHNSTWNNRIACPATNETNAVCTDPTLTNESWVLFGNVNAIPLSASPLRGAGITISGVTTDINGVTRPSPPGIGAFEFIGIFPPSGLTITGHATFKGFKTP